MLEGKNIALVRGGIVLFSELNFSVKRGEHLTIKGDNGSGKSTLLRVIAGFIHPTKGSFYWEEKPVLKKNINFYQQNILYVGHKLNLQSAGRVSDQIKLWRNLYKISGGTIEQALEIWGLANCKHKRICHLSQGQQKRLSLSRCSWLLRPLWLWDEPEAGLDQGGQRHLTEILDWHLNKGGMAVQASHRSESKTLEIIL